MASVSDEDEEEKGILPNPAISSIDRQEEEKDVELAMATAQCAESAAPITNYVSKQAQQKETVKKLDNSSARQEESESVSLLQNEASEQDQSPTDGQLDTCNEAGDYLNDFQVKVEPGEDEGAEGSDPEEEFFEYNDYLKEEDLEEKYIVEQMPNDEIVKIESNCPPSLQEFTETEYFSAFAHCTKSRRQNMRLCKPNSLFGNVVRYLTRREKTFMEERRYVWELWKIKYMYIFNQNQRDPEVVKVCKHLKRKILRRKQTLYRQALQYILEYPERIEPPPPTPEEIQAEEEEEQRELVQKQRRSQRQQLKQKTILKTKRVKPGIAVKRKTGHRKRRNKKSLVISDTVKETKSVELVNGECTETQETPVKILNLSVLEMRQGKYLEIKLPKLAMEELLALKNTGSSRVTRKETILKKLSSNANVEATEMPVLKPQGSNVGNLVLGDDLEDDDSSWSPPNLEANDDQDWCLSPNSTTLDKIPIPKLKMRKTQKETIENEDLETDEECDKEGLRTEASKRTNGICISKKVMGCSVCGRPMTNNHLLNFHMRTHFSFEEQKQYVVKRLEKEKTIGKSKMKEEGNLTPEMKSEIRLRELKYLLDLRTAKLDVEKTADKKQRLSKPATTKKTDKVRINQKRDGNYGPVICTQCGKLLRTIYSLDRHEKAVHAGGVEFAFPCSICGKPFQSTCGVRNHMRTHLNQEEHIKFLSWPGGIEEFVLRLNTDADLSEPPLKKKSWGTGPRVERSRTLPKKRGRPRKYHLDSIKKAKSTSKNKRKQAELQDNVQTPENCQNYYQSQEYGNEVTFPGTSSSSGSYSSVHPSSIAWNTEVPQTMEIVV